MQIDGYEDGPPWIERDGSEGQICVDSQLLLNRVIDGVAPEYIAECFGLNNDALSEFVGDIPWGAPLWARVFEFGELVVDACTSQPKKSRMH